MHCVTYPDTRMCLPSSDFISFDVRDGLQSMSIKNSIFFVNEFTNFSELQTQTNVVVSIDFDFYVHEQSTLALINKLAAFSCRKKVIILAYEDPIETYFMQLDKKHDL